MADSPIDSNVFRILQWIVGGIIALVAGLVGYRIREVRREVRIDTDIEGLKDDVAMLDTRMTDLTTEVRRFNANDEEMHRQMDAAMQAIQGDLDGLKGRFANIESYHSAHSGSLGKLQARLDQIARSLNGGRLLPLPEEED